MDDETSYAASDPHLLGWVHVAQVDNFLRAHTVYGKHPLVGADRDRYVAQTAEVARRLGVLDPPTTEAELAAALAAYRPECVARPRPARRSPTWRSGRRCRRSRGARTWSCSPPPSG